MADVLFSALWRKVARLQPRLRAHCRIQRHDYRGELWYVLHDGVGGGFFRLPPRVYRVIAAMDGTRTMQQLLDLAAGHGGDDAPSQGEMIFLLRQLVAADLLVCDSPIDIKGLLGLGRGGGPASSARLRGAPLFFRIPLFDPDRFLTKTMGVAEFCFSRLGLFLWCSVLLVALLQVFFHWSELAADLVDRVLAKGNLAFLFLVYPAMKSLHELGHGYAVKKWGGEVHEMGVRMLVFVPVPYVDATAASAFRRPRRVVVGLAGIAVEIFLAAIAVLLWVSLEPGTGRALAYNVIIIGGVSTLFFNGNPLLRYDGYFVLTDLLGIPNLAQRSLQYLGYLVNRYVFGLKRATAPYCGPGERFWFVVYGFCSFLYRLMVSCVIIVFVAGKFFFVGVLLALWAAVSMLVLPLFKKMRALFFAPFYREKRARIVGVLAAVTVGFLLMVMIVPVPYFTVVEGVLWVSEDSLVRAKTAGEIVRMAARPDARVVEGEVLVECRNETLQAEVQQLRAQLRESENRYNAALATDQVEADMAREELGNIKNKLSWAERQLAGLTITSPLAGRVVIPGGQDLPGRFLGQGDLVGYVLQSDKATVRVVVPQQEVDLIRSRPGNIELRMATDLGTIHAGRIIREVPGGDDRLPSTALGKTGGGRITVDPFEKTGKQLFEKMFQFDVAIDEPLAAKFIGSRVYVRFNHGYEPLGFRGYRSLRQLFLRRFNV